jgi:hypothetical protein
MLQSRGDLSGKIMGMPEVGRVSGKYGVFNDQPPLEAALVGLGARQHAVFGLDQLVALGFRAAAMQKRAAQGRLHRIYRSVYALVPRELLTREGLYMAAVLACGPGALVSHRSAAVLHGLRKLGGTKVDVSVPGRVNHRHAGVALHRSTTLTPADATCVSNIPCTTIARTLLDLADVISRRPLERAVDQAEILEVFDLRALEDQLDRNASRPAAAVVRSILREHHIGSTPTVNDLEEAMLALTRAAGLPDPQVNSWVDLGDGEPLIQADFVWRAQKVVLETDGRRVHGTAQARERDPRRDQRLTVAGWRPLRTTWRQVMRRSRELQATLAALLQQ